MPYRTVVDVMLICARRDGRVLLAQRAGCYLAGWWNLPSGKLEDGEHALDAVRREAREEVDLHLDADHLTFVGVVHCLNPEQEGRIGLFFAAAHEPDRHGKPRNAEPHKCSALQWCPPDQLPARTAPYTAAGLNLYRDNRTFGLLGWDNPPW